MRTLLRLLFLRNWRSLLTLFFLITFSGIGFITLGQLTTNIETSVATETRPLFGADMIISVDGYTGASLHDIFAPYLKEEQYEWAERHEFSTTLFDQEGKTWLVKVIAYNGTYPQRGILKTIERNQGNKGDKISATPELISRFSSGGVLSLDWNALLVTDTIEESSDLWFSFWTENHLLILPTSLLSGSMLLSSGSRLDYELLISFANEKDTEEIKNTLSKIFPKETYRIRTYEERSDRNIETVSELTNYIFLILLVSSIFALVILRSAHDSFFENLSRTLRIIETLGFTRKRQMLLFTILYASIFPLALSLAGICGYGILEYIASYPEAKNFHWFFDSFFSSLLLLGLLVFAAFYPAWSKRWITQWEEAPLWKKMIQSENTINIIIWIIVVSIIFDDIIFAFTGIVLWSLIIVLIAKLISWIYSRLHQYMQIQRFTKFPIYDGFRTLVRPFIPTIPITVSLVSVTTFFLVFLLFSFSFRSQLSVDTRESANMYALNILESDKKNLEKILSGSEMYSILRARISRINGKSLAEFLNQEKPSGEFTREFNITTSPLENSIIRWKDTITANEVSIDDAFAKRLWVDIGDRIDFLLSGKSITLTIANIRESTRQGFRPFFYFSFDPIAFEKAPKTYFASTYTDDRESWKKSILENSGPHVTFIDVENILSIVRDISGKILAVIWLFMTVVWVFALFAVLSFFSRMRNIEVMKQRLYKLFWLLPRNIMTSLRISRIVIFALSWILSISLGITVAYFTIWSSSILTLSWWSVWTVIMGSLLVYLFLIILLKPQDTQP
jgi:putative ABC transport system permease protein